MGSPSMSDAIDRATDPLTTVRVVLPDGYSVSGAFLSAVQAQVEDVLPQLKPGHAYTADELCGPEFWNDLGPGEQRNAGRCLAYLVAQGALPLVHVPGKHEYPRRYRLKTDGFTRTDATICDAI